MKQKTIYTLFIVAVFAFMAASVSFACDGTASASCLHKNTDAKLTSVKSGCSFKSTSATLTSSDQVCTPEQMAACAKAMNMSKEECANLCDSKGTMTAFAVTGMTCGGCETSLKAALSDIDGVFHVAKVSYKSKQAIVCYDAKKANPETFIKAITDKGYTAQIIPAVATTVDSRTAFTGNKKACGAKSSTSATTASTCSAKKNADQSKGSL